MSCEKCTRCSYTYRVTTIVQTINGEVEDSSRVTSTLLGPDGEAFVEECVKKDDPETIRNWYQGFLDTTSLEYPKIICTDI